MVCKLLLYTILVKCLAFLEQPSRTLRHVAELMRMSDSWSYAPGLERPLHFWPMFLSPWLMTVIAFVLWALLDSLVELAADRS